jgi:hypothetical protein
MDCCRPIDPVGFIGAGAGGAICGLMLRAADCMGFCIMLAASGFWIM